MPEETNRRITLTSRPVGYPVESDFTLEEVPIPEAKHGEVLLKTIWLSLDPYMRGRISAAQSYTAGVEIGGVVTGEVVGRVVASGSPQFQTGDIVRAGLGWQEYGVVPAYLANSVDLSFGPASTALGVLGMPGLTAYFGLLEVGRPVPGDTVIVSAASGAVGSVVGQVARIIGCRVVGIAGTDEKVDYITDELGFDAGINYRTEDVGDALSDACPNGVDVYFDNVGGAITDAVLDHLAPRARIAVCGQISQYNLAEPEAGPRNMRQLLVNQARMEGFLVFRFESRYEEARPRLAEWVKADRVKYREDIVAGLENAPRAFIGMMRGANFGKLLIGVSDDA